MLGYASRIAENVLPKEKEKVRKEEEKIASYMERDRERVLMSKEIEEQIVADKNLRVEKFLASDRALKAERQLEQEREKVRDRQVNKEKFMEHLERQEKILSERKKDKETLAGFWDKQVEELNRSRALSDHDMKSFYQSKKDKELEEDQAVATYATELIYDQRSQARNTKPLEKSRIGFVLDVGPVIRATDESGIRIRNNPLVEDSASKYDPKTARERMSLTWE